MAIVINKEELLGMQNQEAKVDVKEIEPKANISNELESLTRFIRELNNLLNNDFIRMIIGKRLGFQINNQNTINNNGDNMLNLIPSNKIYEFVLNFLEKLKAMNENMTVKEMYDYVKENKEVIIEVIKNAFKG